MQLVLAVIGGLVVFCFFFSLSWRAICSIDSKNWKSNPIVIFTSMMTEWITIIAMAIVIIAKFCLSFSWNALIRILSAKPKSWKDDPATEKQKSFADDLGIDYSDNITKGELSALIDIAKTK